MVWAEQQAIDYFRQHRRHLVAVKGFCAQAGRPGYRGIATRQRIYEMRKTRQEVLKVAPWFTPAGKDHGLEVPTIGQPRTGLRASAAVIVSRQRHLATADRGASTASQAIAAPLGTHAVVTIYVNSDRTSVEGG